MGEGGDPALAGQVVADERDLADLGRVHDGEPPADHPGSSARGGHKEGAGSVRLLSYGLHYARVTWPCLLVRSDDCGDRGIGDM